MDRSYDLPKLAQQIADTLRWLIEGPLNSDAVFEAVGTELQGMKEELEDALRQDGNTIIADRVRELREHGWEGEQDEDMVWDEIARDIEMAP